MTKIPYTTNVFTKIISKELAANIVMENDKFMCFKDHAPQAPVHLLVIPKGEYLHFSDFMSNSAHRHEFFEFAMEVLEQNGIDTYKLIMNTGEEAGQCVPHFHMHILSGMGKVE